MSFSDKRVLASRRLVHTCVLVQLLAFAVSAKALYGFHASDQAISDRCEFQMFWLVPFASSEGIPRGFWLHFAWRLLVWAHNAYLALLFAGPFHRAEDLSRGTLEEKLKDPSYIALYGPEQMQHALEETPDRTRNIRAEVVYLQYEFDRLPATVFTKYLEHAFTILVASVSMHGLARDFGGKSKLLHMDWGQRAPLIVCLVGVIHFTYAQARNFDSNSLKRLWEAELVTGAYPNRPDHPGDYPSWARPTPTSVCSLRFLQHMWCVVKTQRKLSTLRAPNFPRCGPINLAERLNPSWWDIWKNPFPKSIVLSEGLIQPETERLWKDFDTLGPFGIREALLNGARINDFHDDDNRTVLLRLLNANQCDTRIVALALLMGADTNVTLPKKNYGIEDSTPLVVASGRGHVNVACYLLDHYPGIPDTATALVSAARSAHKDVVGLLISRGLDVNISCPSTGETALIAAAGNGHVDTVGCLLFDHRADVNIRCHKSGDTALMVSLRPEHTNVLKFLTNNDFGIDINAKSHRGAHGINFDYTWYDGDDSKAHYYYDIEHAGHVIHGSRPVRRNHEGDAALHRAACLSSLDALEILLNLDSSEETIRQRNLSGDTVLIVAIRDGDPTVAAEMVRLLLQKDPEMAGVYNYVGKSALDFCLERTPNDNTACLEALLEYGENNVAGLDWKTWVNQIPQWGTRPWYSRLQSILTKPVGDYPCPIDPENYPWSDNPDNYPWPIDQQWHFLSVSGRHRLEVNDKMHTEGYIGLRLPQPETQRVLRVRRIVFRIVSNDQGWSSYPETHNFYDGSWTWFDAKVVKHDQQEEMQYQKYKFKRRICRNLHAVGERQQHTFIWDYRDRTPHLDDWLDLLKPDDKIQLLATQVNPRWDNKVHEADMKVFYSWEPATA